MSDSKKTIQINPEFLKFSSSGGKTRKTRPDKPIKMKVEPTENNKTTKRKILNYIRKQQEETYKHLLKDDIAKVKPVSDSAVKSDFESSLEFLENVVKAPPAPKNTTLKTRPLINPYPIVDENVAILPPENIFEAIVPPIIPSGHVMQLTKPNYGCLKGGALPTYRAWKSQTQKNADVVLPKMTEEQNRAELRQFFKKRKNEKHKMENAKRPFDMQNRQKRTMRRTFRVGKSKVYPKIGVLVSNRTIRNQIQSKCQLLKETSIEEVKKYLVKHGLIRIGCSTPNDVLRKIYESAMLMCGEIHNHNPDNLLYNYFNNGIDV